MRIIDTIEEMQAVARSYKMEGKSIVFVPTMGFLHEGHASLLREGRKRGDILVLSIFVNPIQFGQNEDLDRYPRNLDGDCRIADQSGVDIIFTPTAAEMYPAGFQTSITVKQVSQPLCGASRPGHFDGVATVVTKLFNIVMPDVALFGCKDFQQLAVIKRMVADLSLPVNVVGMPIVREADGLAMSSRNVYLSAQERQSALCLIRSIRAVHAAYVAGERDVAVLRRLALEIINQEPAVQIDYLEFCNSGTLDPVALADEDTLMALAVKVGKTRLIDNNMLEEDQ